MRSFKNTRIGKKQTNGLATCCGPIYAAVAQIFLECAGNKAGCHETIAIIPTGSDANYIVDHISDQQAGKLFAAHGWLVKGYNSTKYTRCPICKQALKAKP